MPSAGLARSVVGAPLPPDRRRTARRGPGGRTRRPRWSRDDQRSRGHHHPRVAARAREGCATGSALRHRGGVPWRSVMGGTGDVPPGAPPPCCRCVLTALALSGHGRAPCVATAGRDACHDQCRGRHAAHGGDRPVSSAVPRRMQRGDHGVLGDDQLEGSLSGSARRDRFGSPEGLGQEDFFERRCRGEILGHEDRCELRCRPQISEPGVGRAPLPRRLAEFPGEEHVLQARDGAAFTLLGHRSLLPPSDPSSRG